MAFKIDFKKLSDPEYQAEYKRKKEAEEKIEQEKEQLRLKTVMFTGHRPNKLGGYDMKNPKMLQLKDKLIEIIEDLIVNENVSRFISGGALGTDQAGFWVVEILKKKYPSLENIVAIPFKNQDKVWTSEQKQWYGKLLEKADSVINVEELDEYKTNENVPFGEFSAAKMQKRNEYMVDHSKFIIAVFDGSKGGTSNCLWYARKRMLNHALYRLHPSYNFELDVQYLM